MRGSPAIAAAILAASCVSPTNSFDVDRFQSSFPEFGLTAGPDGYYLYRSEGPFAGNHRSQIWRYPFGGGDPALAPFSHTTASDSDFSWHAESERGCFVRDADIYCAQWDADEGWMAAQRLAYPINSDGYEASPHIAPDGTLYFASMREDGFGLGDIYRATGKDNGWTVEILGSAINGPYGEWNLTLSSDGKVMVFESSGRPTNRTASGDLYFSCLVEGQWQAAKPLTRLNTDNSDLDFRFAGAREGVFTSATIGGDGILRYAGPENFAMCD